MISYKTREEIELIRESSLLVGKTLAEVAGHIEPGADPRELDRLAETFIRDHGAEPGFKGYEGFPASLCISVNEAVVHGIPTDRLLEEGDVVSVDCGVLKNGYYGDSAFTFPVGKIDSEVAELMKATRESLDKAVEVAVPGKRIGDIGAAVQGYIAPKGYGIVKELVGHGLGRELHEKPEVPNYGRRGTGPLLKKGLVIAIEPMINLGTGRIKHLSDGWTVVTADGKPSAHYEHTIALTEEGHEVLTSFEEIDRVLEARHIKIA